MQPRLPLTNYNNRQRSKYWCYTINNPTDSDKAPPEEEYTYHVVGEEVGEEGTHHFQGYIEMKKLVSLHYMKLLLPRAHLEKRMGTAKEASDYCKKDGKFKEFGTLSLPQGSPGGQATKRKYEEAYALAVQGNLDDIEKDLLVKHYHAFKRIKQDHPEVPTPLEDVCGIWYYGPPNTGKSYTARERYPGLYDKPCNKWFDGYRGEDTVLIDDFDLNHKVLGHHLKRWADRYSFPAESKGTTTPIRPKRIIVTSNYTIAEIFCEDPVLCKALERRFVVEEFLIPINEI